MRSTAILPALAPRAASILLGLAGVLSGCQGNSRVMFIGGQCLIDGVPATLTQVEARQAAVAAHILGRQPLFVVITLLVVALAGMSHIEKLAMLFSARRAEVRGLGERVRVALDRYRAHPVRYFGIVAGTLTLLVLAASTYIYLDADKRSSERALSMLQFCHISLRTQGERGALDEQRQNLEAIQTTAADIRSLVAKLPPQEQRKAQEIIAQMNDALGHQGRLVTDYLQRTDEANRLARERTSVLERGLSAMEADVLTLKMLPGQLSTLAGGVQGTSAKVDAVDGKLGGALSKLDAVDGKVGGVASKFAGLDGRLAGLDNRLAGLDNRLAGLETRLTGVDGKLGGCEARLTALETALRSAARPEKEVKAVKEAKEAKEVAAAGAPAGRAADEAAPRKNP